jgi:hypothetical protein
LRVVGLVGQVMQVETAVEVALAVIVLVLELLAAVLLLKIR